MPGISETGTFPGNPRRFDVTSNTVSISSGANGNLLYPNANLTPVDDSLTAINSGFSSYIGTGTVHLDYSYLYNVVINPSASESSNSGLTDTFSGTITYDFTKIPEPTTAAVAIVGAIAIVARRRFRS